jgi:hypothetical protein
MHARKVKLKCYNWFSKASIKGDTGEGENELIKKLIPCLEQVLSFDSNVHIWIFYCNFYHCGASIVVFWKDHVA